MAEPDNRSEESATVSGDVTRLESPQTGLTRLSLTLLIVLVIVVTAVVSVFRNEVISIIRKTSASLFPISSSVQHRETGGDGKAELYSEPGVSVVAPSASGVDVYPEKSNTLTPGPEDSDKTGKGSEKPAITAQNQESEEGGASSKVQDSSPRGPVKANSGNENGVSTDPGSRKDGITPTVSVGAGSSSIKDGLEKSPEEKSIVTPTKESPTNQTGATSEPPNRAKTEKHTISEEFQLPGSILVKIHNYSGVKTRWAIMVVLDNSGVMNHESKQWTPARIKLAKDIISSVLETVGPNSKISMKDFSCKGSSSKDKAPCPPHSVFDWTEYPFKGLKEKVNTVGLGNPSNTCVSVIQSMRKDFVGVGNNVPRILYITCGQSKCPPKDIRLALNRQIPGGRVIVDVLGLGIPTKRIPAYSLFAKKTGGLLLTVENPAQMETAIARYKKALNTLTLEKIEIRSDKATVTVSPGQEIALVPGSYTVVLPRVKGIADSHRALSSVKIKSGHTTLIEVNPKKGKASVKIVDKNRPSP